MFDRIKKAFAAKGAADSALLPGHTPRQSDVHRWAKMHKLGFEAKADSDGFTIGAEIGRCGPENGGQKGGHTDNGQKNSDSKRKEAVKSTITKRNSPLGLV